MAVIKQPPIIIRCLGCVNGPAGYFLLMYAITTNMANTMMTMMCTGNYLFNSLMVFLASPLLRKYPIIFDITDDTDLSSSSAISLRKSSLSLVVLNDKKESFFIVKIYNKV
tara:strand:+ start:116 stop:448 length:333 start_codon:yes stop_codon:yes gene_type:complete